MDGLVGACSWTWVLAYARRGGQRRLAGEEGIGGQCLRTARERVRKCRDMNGNGIGSRVPNPKLMINPSRRASALYKK